MSGFYGQTAPAPALAPAQPSAPTQVSGKTGNYYTGSPNPSTATTGNGFAPPPAVKALAPGQTMTPTGGAGFHGGSGAASPLPGAGPSSPTRPSMASAPGVPNSRYHVTPGNPFTDPSRGIYVGEIPSTPTGPQHWMPAVRR